MLLRCVIGTKNLFEKLINRVVIYLQLQTHQQLVDAERDELSSKLAKLTKFINSDRFTKIVTNERERIKLILQESIMQDYWNVLIYRITTFK